MKRLTLLLTLLAVAILGNMISASQSFAQTKSDTLQVWAVETRDGNEYLGSILDSTDVEIVIDTKTLGRLTIPRTEIAKYQLVKASQLVQGEYWSENRQSTRYFWAPNGFALKPGEGYYQNVWVVFNQVSFGVSESMSIGIGTIPTFLADGASTPFWVTPKFSLSPKEDSKVRFGVGGLFGSIIGEQESGYGIVYGVMTIGTRDSNINFGAGMGYAGGGWAPSPTLTLSAMVRTGKRGYFITENYLITDAYESLGIIMIGGRMVGERMSFDLGLMAPMYGGQIDFALPWLGISVPMGRL